MAGKRSGCKDIWNAFMCSGAQFSQHDIPFCPTTAKELPRQIITWTDAKAIYKMRLSQHDVDFFYNAFVCFYEDDQNFDGVQGIWHNSSNALKILHHFAGAITPDFSTYQDFPVPLKMYNTFRMRTFGYWMGKNNIPVYNNVRWGTPESWEYCFEGIPTDDIVAIGTVGGSPRKIVDRQRFEIGLDEMVRVLHPHTIIVYGSASYPCFFKLTEEGIKIISYPSKTSDAYERGKER